MTTEKGTSVQCSEQEIFWIWNAQLDQNRLLSIQKSDFKNVCNLGGPVCYCKYKKEAKSNLKPIKIIFSMQPLLRECPN